VNARKYNVGKIARKHLLAAIEVLMESDSNSIVFMPCKKYSIRARRKPHGIELK
jgi:hypothetical protein